MGNAISVEWNVQTGNGLIRAPAYHRSGCEVVRALKQALDRVECAPGHTLEQRQFGNLLGVPKSTIHDWFHSKLPGPIHNFLCVFERLPETDRILLLREFCRPCPRLDHPRLAHDTETLNRLKTLLNQRTGLTIVVGPSEPRTFLVTAMGHFITRVESTTRACGLDAHKPDTFVPVAGVLYCHRPPTFEQAQELVAHIMEDVEGSDAEWIIFNGVCTALLQYRSTIRRLAASRQVIVAGDSVPVLKEIAKVCANPPLMMVVSQIQGKQGLIHVEFREPEQCWPTSQSRSP
jgi:hypothetical protein